MKIMRDHSVANYLNQKVKLGTTSIFPVKMKISIEFNSEKLN